MFGVTAFEIHFVEVRVAVLLAFEKDFVAVFQPAEGLRARAAEQLSSLEAADLRDALRQAAGRFPGVYVIRPPHNPLGPVCTAATVHLAAAVPNFAWAECRETPGEENRSQDSPIFIDRLRLEGARYPVPSAPGLGIDIDEAKLAEAAYSGLYESPHLRRSDGGLTNR